MPSPSDARSGEHGTILLPVAALVVLVGGLSLGLLYEALGERTSLRRAETSLLALQVAEAGIVQAEMEIFALEDTGDDGVGVVSGTLGAGSFTVEAVQDVLLPDRWTLRARGEVEHSVRRIEVGVRRRMDEAFLEALFARDDLVFHGSAQTDSYDSRLGDHASQVASADDGGDYAGTRGHVGSNARVVVQGTKAHIRGNAIPGPLYAVESAGDPVIYGDQVPRRREVPIGAVTRAEFEEALASNDNDLLLALNEGKGAASGKHGPYDPRTMSLTGKSTGTILVPPGTYFLTDVDLSAQSELHITGPTTFYVTGDLDLTGAGIVNATGRPADLTIYQHPYPLPPGHQPTDTVARLRGGSQAAFALFAPEVEVTLLGDSEYFGAAVGRTIDVGGDVAFHYDEALGTTRRLGAVFLERLYWRELGRPIR